MNKYAAIYKNKRAEIQAGSAYEAQIKAVKLFNVKRVYDVCVVLIEKAGQEVIHKADF